MKHPAQENDVVPGRKIGLVGIGIIVATVVCALVAWGLGRNALSAGARVLGVPPNPAAIENAPYIVEAQGLALTKRSEAYLASYGWVDRDRGIVHIPIDVAMQLYLARHAPTAGSAGAGGDR